jgi:hypothetical protein
MIDYLFCASEARPKRRPLPPRARSRTLSCVMAVTVRLPIIARRFDCNPGKVKRMPTPTHAVIMNDARLPYRAAQCGATAAVALCRASSRMSGGIAAGADVGFVGRFPLNPACQMLCTPQDRSSRQLPRGVFVPRMETGRVGGT